MPIVWQAPSYVHPKPHGEKRVGQDWQRCQPWRRAQRRDTPHKPTRESQPPWRLRPNERDVRTGSGRCIPITPRTTPIPRTRISQARSDKRMVTRHEVQEECGAWRGGILRDRPKNKLSIYQYMRIYCYTDSQSSDRRRHRLTAWAATSRRHGATEKGATKKRQGEALAPPYYIINTKKFPFAIQIWNETRHITNIV